MVHSDDRYRMFQKAWLRTGLTLEQLWIAYVANFGSASAFELDAWLAGLAPLSCGQQDVLACTLNEHLDDLGEPLRVPYTTSLPDQDALVPLLQELIEGRAR